MEFSVDICYCGCNFLLHYSGAGFLLHFNLLVDLKNCCLIDNNTNTSDVGIIRSSDKIGIHSALPTCDLAYLDIFKIFPNLLKPICYNCEIKDHVTRHITTCRQPVHSKSRQTKNSKRGILTYARPGHYSSMVIPSSHGSQTDPTRWSECLPIVLLGLWSMIKEDIKSTSAEMVYETALLLPGRFFTQPNQNATANSNYMSRLREHMAKLSFTLTRVHSNMAYLPPNINVSEFVFVYQDTVKKSLQPNYDRPNKVLE